MRYLLLTADDFTKEPSRRWPRKSLVQWIEDTFGYDDHIGDFAWVEAFNYITNHATYLDHEYHSQAVERCEELSVSAWCEHPSVTLEQIAECWNSIVGAMQEEYGSRLTESSSA